MASKKSRKPKGKWDSSTAMFPNLHQAVSAALSDEIINPAWWFNKAGNDSDSIQEYDTHIMGRFECRNRTCSQTGWGSGKIAIQIREYARHGYNAVVFKQRCRQCNAIGSMQLDEPSYIERVSYRLKKWSGIKTDKPKYDKKTCPEHEKEFCEGCKMGHCLAGRTARVQIRRLEEGWCEF